MKHLLSIVTALLCISAYAQYQTAIFDPNVRTLQMKYAATDLVEYRPILTIKNGVVDGSEDDNSLIISFDQLSHDLQHYSYTILHLNYDWTPSDISSYDYVEGFTTNDIVDYEHSLNTQQAYTHYWLAFPNEDMQLTASGNYVLVIYQDGDIEQVVAQVCFSVVEPMVGIEVKQRANTDIEYNGRYQQLDIDIQTSALDLRSSDDMKLVVQQNNRRDNQVVLTKPTYQSPTQWRFINQKELIFEAGNEFRRFDTYSTYYAGYHVDKIRYAQGEYHALLETDEVRGNMAKGASREGLPYLSDMDVDGQYVINCEKSDYADTEAEYMWVHFFLPVSQPVINGNVFVGGDMCYNLYTAGNRMKYDAEHKGYYTSLYLKQGGYNYMYYTIQTHEAFMSSNSAAEASTLMLEGSHWQTQNEYRVFVYYRPFGGRYDRLVGVR